MEDSRNGNSLGHGATISLLVLVMILFALVVGYGWLRLLAFAMDPTIAGVVAALITVIAILLGRMIARIWLSDEARGKLLLLYPVLFVISALGTINAAFYNFEGGSVLLQVIDDTEKRLASLDAASMRALRDEGPEARAAADVERLLIQLQSEIMNPQNCGVGPEARRIIASINRILPQFQPLSKTGRMPTCDEATLLQLYKVYENNALRMLDIDPARRDRLAVRTDIAGPVARAMDDLRKAETRLATGGGFGNGYLQAQLALENASTIYADAREKLAAVQPAAAAPLAPAVDISRSRDLGSITTMPGTLAARLNYWTTWFYLVTAVLFDLLLVFLFLEGLRQAAPITVVPVPVRHNDPQFLWVNEGA